MGPVRILITATPRSRSTALEQSFRQREDCAVHHELCAAPHYYGSPATDAAAAADAETRDRTAVRLGQAGAALAAEGAGATVAAVLAGLLEAPESLVLSKELSFYYNPDLVDASLLGRFVHVFLVRDPKATIESLYRTSLKGDTTYFDASETGFDELERAIVHAHDVLGVAHPCVITSDALVHDTEATLRKICRYAAVPFDDAMLSWEASKEGGADRRAWAKWSGWHGDTMASTGFAKREHAACAFPPEVAAAVDAQTPTYERIMSWQKSFETSLLAH